MLEYGMYCCTECGGLMDIDSTGVSYHVDEDGQQDYDTDLDHVSYADPDVEEPKFL